VLRAVERARQSGDALGIDDLDAMLQPPPNPERYRHDARDPRV